MGNQYSVSTTDHVYPVEHYFIDLPGFALETKLGSTRFMKVARALHHEGTCVVKVFVIHDRSLSLDMYEKSLTAQRDALYSSQHCLPFSYFVRSDRFAALSRAYVKDTLYDRMSARPYLTDLEKKWIAFQMLLGMQECHEKNICHGDIKTSNIAVTSWNWVYFTDFASFKPTYLPDGDPADYNYYFDTSRRRTCYIAPERFMRGVVDPGDVVNLKANLPDQQQEARMGNLNWSMDIFSLGCVFLEFFGEGEAPFDLSKLLAYRNGDFYPSESLNKIECSELRGMIEHMIQKDPMLRSPAMEYMKSLRGSCFPETFYSFLNTYMHSYSLPGVPDDKIMKLHRDLSGIIAKLPAEDSGCITIVLSLLLSNWRSLSHSDAKLAALDIAEILAPLLPVDIVLDRLLPYLLTCVDDKLPIVRSNFIITFSKILQTIPSIRRNEGHIFRAFILPDIEKLVEDTDQRVRITFAMHFAQLAETAMKFLELSYLSPSSTSSQDLVYGLHDEDRYPFDVERMLLLRYFQSLLEKLILKQGNPVKRALLEHGMGKLCQVFGRKLTRELILPHLVTFLNEKPDWQLRAAFFKAIAALASFVGLEGAGVFRALLEQGLTDPEEFVVFHALCSFLDLVRLRLMPKKSLTELLSFCAALLLHPNTWIRRSTVALFVTASKTTDFADQQTRIRPLLLPFLESPIVFIDEEEALLGALISPVSRRIHNIFTEGRGGRKLLEFLEIYSDDRMHLSPDNEAILRSTTEYQPYQKLLSLEIAPSDKIKILLIKEFISRLRSPTQTMEKELSSEAEDQAERTKSITKVAQSVPIRSIPDLPGFEGMDVSSASITTTKGKKYTVNDHMLRTAMSEEWATAFGTPISATVTPYTSQHSSAGSDSNPSIQEPFSDSHDVSLLGRSENKYVRIPACEREVQRFIQTRLQERSVELSNEVSLTDLEPPPMYYEMLKEWRPAGILVAHLHEHHNSVTRLRSNKNSGEILSCSLDGTVKLWDCARMEGKGLSNRAKYTYKTLGGPVRAMTYCEEWKSFACAAEHGTIHIVRMDVEHSKGLLKLERAVDAKRDGHIVEMGYCDPGTQNIVTFVTSMGVIAGWDLRTPNYVWKLQSDLRYGMVNTFCVRAEQSSVTTGSQEGVMVTWDLRFRIAISSLHHPAASPINRLYTHPKLDSGLIVCSKGNNEVSVWDTETGMRTMALWSGISPLVASPQTNDHSIRGLQVISPDSRGLSFITAGTDRRIRFWDSGSPELSYVISAATGETLVDKKMICKNSQVDGVEVLQEYQTGIRSMSASTSVSASWMKESENNSRLLMDTPSTGHSDGITDLVTCSTGNQLFLVTASRDGIVKVWK